ncbi:cation:proton antiporter [Marinicella sp. W31]|uniref:cation:proton antiporter domain-containing protein n=1 Tax=Marinicella sp. W31 TaxID=3023713 RepID=UPI003758486E
MTETFIIASLILAFAVLIVPLANRMNLGSILGYLVAGAIVGVILRLLAPVMGYDTSSMLEQLNHTTEFGVVLMLFVIGLEIQPSQLWKMKSAILGAGGLQVSLTALVIMGIAMLFSLPWQTGLAIGLILALSSTALIMQTLDEKGLNHTIGGRASFSALLFQDIAIIPIIAVLPLLALPGAAPTVADDGHGHGINVMAMMPDWAGPLVVIGGVVLVYIISRHLVNPLFRYIARARQREIFTTATLGLVVLIAALMSVIGISPALGVFIAGVILSESEYRHELEADIEPFKGLLLGIFFMTVGAGFDFALFGQQPLLILGLAVLLMLVKMAILFCVGLMMGLKKIENMLFFIALAQGGEFAFVLLSLALSENVLATETADILRIVVALSMAMTPLLFLIYERMLMPRMLRPKEQETREADTIDESNSIIIAGSGRFGQIVARLLKNAGFSVTILENDPNMIDTLRKFGWKVYYGDATRSDLLRAAGLEKASAFVIAIDNSDKIVELVEMAQHQCPDVPLFVRARDRVEAYRLHNMGVQHIFRETFDASLAMGEKVLGSLGFRAFQARRARLRYAHEDERLFRELAGLWAKDEDKHVIEAQEQYSRLEALLKSEINEGKQIYDDNGSWSDENISKDFGNKP